MRRYSFGVCAALAFAWVGAAAVRADDPPKDPPRDPIVPVYHEPHHRQVFQYGPTRILDLQIPPGDKSWFHSHESPVLYVTLGTSRTRTQNLGEEWGGGGAARGGAGVAVRRRLRMRAPSGRRHRRDLLLHLLRPAR